MKTTDDIMKLIDWQLSEDDVIAVRAAIDELQTEIKVLNKALINIAVAKNCSRDCPLNDSCDVSGLSCSKNHIQYARKELGVANES